MEKGLIEVYTGDGKGKTTAAVGLAVRAAGRGFKVLMTQFLKDNNTGELISIQKIPGFCVYSGEPVKKFFEFMTDSEKKELVNEHRKRFKEVILKAKNEKYDMLILDEIIASVNLNIIDINDLMEFLKNKPESLEVVLTGRNPKEEILEIADYVSEIKAIKHPYKNGISARIGIER
ncbi:cob(I)yrinic acid a,c-diamide adenosyltransferase [Clostridium sp. BJN0001]|uniref:cob(I)yrinic acid a,c-diamide adenosyltransferase n=1 Tax=Clostridium sp. BJN0001 TaxID=2930219 RepID=UPI001FD16B79|nr:cob(I)yrinic acid a,c-diamide adenosyltransferase [Clostridium sp. BJN0001]